MTPSVHRTIKYFPSFTLAVLLAANPPLSAAPAPAMTTGARLLLDEVHGSAADLDHAGCDVLAASLRRAVLKHHAQAVPILVAALTRGKEANAKEPCECVSRLLRTAIIAAPDQASPMFEQAILLYPGCEKELTALLDRLEDKNVVAPGTNDPNQHPATQTGQGASVSDPDGLDGSEFGVGLGDNFPGAPGFVGSPPGGSAALPPPVPPATTSVVGE